LYSTLKTKVTRVYPACKKYTDGYELNWCIYPGNYYIQMSDCSWQKQQWLI